MDDWTNNIHDCREVSGVEPLVGDILVAREVCEVHKLLQMNIPAGPITAHQAVVRLDTVRLIQTEI